MRTRIELFIITCIRNSRMPFYHSCVYIFYHSCLHHMETPTPTPTPSPAPVAYSGTTGSRLPDRNVGLTFVITFALFFSKVKGATLSDRHPILAYLSLLLLEPILLLEQPNQCLCTVKPVFKTTWEIKTTWELRTATSVPRSIHHTEMGLRNKTSSEFRTVLYSPLGVPNSQVPLY